MSSSSKQAHDSSSSSSSSYTKQVNETDIAVVGVSSILASGENLYENWESIRAGLDHVAELPADRVDITAYYNPDKTAKDQVYCKQGFFIPDYEIDPRDYGLNFNQVEDADANQLLTLLKVKEALSDAHISPQSKDRKNVGVVLGLVGGAKASHEFYSRLNYVVMDKVLKKMGMSDEDAKVAVDKYKAQFPEWRVDSFPGFLGNVTAGRCCNVFNLDGMNCVVDAACASSLIALKVAIDELLHGDCDTMICGATCTDNSLGMYMAFSKTPVFSTDPKVSAYDEGTKGMLIGEGSVMLVLKKLSKAIADGDQVHCVIKGVASSSDGKTPGIYVPTVSGQELCIERAWQKVGEQLNTCTMLEGHGTGTPVGDRIELTGMRNQFEFAGKASKEQIAVGSIKSQVGHTKAVAGFAGLVKVILALKHKVLPKTINVKNPPAFMDGTKMTDSCLYLNTRSRPWFVDSKLGVRRAGLSSFGFGGANYHMVVEEYEQEHTKPYRMHDLPVPVLFSAPTPVLLAQALQTVITAIESLPTAEEQYDALIRIRQENQVGTSQAGAPPVSHARAGLLAKDDAKAFCADLRVLIAQTSSSSPSSAARTDLVYRASGVEGKLAALFPGQRTASAELHMLDEVAMNWPEFRETVVDFDRVDAADGTALRNVMYPRAPYQSEGQALVDKQKAQLAEREQMAIACASVGAYEVFQRAGLRVDAVAGEGGLGEFSALYAAGAVHDKTALAELIKARALAMKGTRADQHNTPQMAQAERQFFDKLSQAKLQPPKIKTVSGSTGAVLASVADIKQVLSKHMTSPSDFAAQLKDLHGNQGVRVFVSFGLGAELAQQVQQTLGSSVHCVSVNGQAGSKNSDLQLREAALQCAVLGARFAHAFDPWTARNPFKGLLGFFGDADATKKALASKTRVRMGASTYVSKKTLAERHRVLEDGQQFKCFLSGSSGSSGVPASTVKAETQQELQRLKQQLDTVKADTHKSEQEVVSLKRSLEEAKAHSSALEEVNQKFHLEKLLQEYEVLSKQLRAALLGGPVGEIAPPSKLVPVAVVAAAKPVAAAPAPVVAAAAPTNGGANRGHVESVLRKVLSESTGFDESMLTNDLNLEEDLGIDSIKRVEFVSNVSGQFGVTVGAEAMDKLARTRLVGEVVEVFVNDVFGGGGVSAAAPVAAPKPVAAAAVAPKAAAAAASAPDAGGLSRDQITKVLQKVLSESTGFDESMLTNDLNLEEDLGIDSIKRVEFVSNVSGQFGVTVGPEAMDKLARTRLVGEVVDVFVNDVFGSAAPAAVSAPKPAAAAPVSAAAKPASNGGANRGHVESVLRKVLSESTGFDESMLTNDLNLEEDLGIDSIKRVEFVSNVSGQFGVTVGPEAMDKLARTRLVGEVVDVFVNDVFGGASAAPAVAPKAAAAAASAPDAGGLSRDQITKVLQKVLSESTGFDESMLTNDLNLEEDLGIDSIKRVEFVSNVSGQFGVTVGPEAMDKLARTRLVGEVVDVFVNDVFGGAFAAAPKPAAAAAPTNGKLSSSEVVKVLQKVLSESTGFDESMLTNDLNLEEDLGIDSIKRVEFVSNVSGKLNITVSAEAMDRLARTRLVGEVLEVFTNL